MTKISTTISPCSVRVDIGNAAGEPGTQSHHRSFSLSSLPSIVAQQGPPAMMELSSLNDADTWGAHKHKLTTHMQSEWWQLSQHGLIPMVRCANTTLTSFGEWGLQVTQLGRAV